MMDSKFDKTLFTLSIENAYLCVATQSESFSYDGERIDMA